MNSIEFDPSYLKIGLIMTFGLYYFTRIIFSNQKLNFHKEFFWILLCASAITIHYIIFGTSDNEDNALIISTGYMLFFMNFAAANYFLPKIKLNYFNNYMAFFGIIFTILNSAGFITGDDSAYIDGNYVGITSNANMLAAYMVLIFFFPMLQMVVHGNVKSKKYLYALFCIVAIYIVYLTRSRSIFISVSAALLFLIVTSKFISLKNKYVFSTISIFLICIGVFVLSGKYEGVDLFGTREALFQQRLIAISERPLVGWGFNSDVSGFYYIKTPFPPMEKGNTILQFIEEFGIIFGSILIFSLYYFVIKLAFRLRSKTSEFALPAFLIAGLVHLFFETWVINFQSWFSLYFWLIIFIGVCQVNRRADSKAPRLLRQDARFV